MKKRHSAEQIMAKMRQADMELGKELTVPEGVQATEDHGSDLLPVAAEVRGDGP